jgi:hypothetical protein
MNIQEFGEKHRVKVRKDECGNLVILGRMWKEQPKGGRQYGHHIYEHGDGQFGLCLMFDGSPARWTYAKRKLTAAGFVIRQDGHGEGIATFDPANAKQSRLAIGLAGARVKRVLTPEQLEAARARLKHARQAKAAQRTH